MNQKLLNITNWCIDLILPKHCLGCQKESVYLCLDCFDALPLAKSIPCFICGRRSPLGYACKDCLRKRQSHLSVILVSSDWDNLLLRQIIYEYKYRFIKELADPLSELMINFLQTNKLIDRKSDQIILVPVPLHGRRLAWRGFNQSELLAQKISGHFSIPLIKNVLIRGRHTLPQREIKNHNARTANIKNAFALNQKIDLLNNNFIKNKVIILADDVCTTGSTLEECARVLKPLGPKEIWGLVIARG